MNNFPSYLSKNKFNQTQLSDLLSTGKLDNTRDNFGNIILKTEEISKDSLIGDYILKVPIGKKKLIKEQVETFYDTSINEFQTLEDKSDLDSGITTTEDITLLQEIDEELDEQKLLQAQIDELSERLDEEMQKSVKFTEDANETYRASRDIIISQRISAGEGNSPNDFSDVFPFLPLTEQQKNEEPDIESFPFSS